MAPKNMVFGLCPAGTEFYDFTKASFELLRGCILKKYGFQSLARLLGLFLILTTVTLWYEFSNDFDAQSEPSQKIIIKSSNRPL